MPTDPSEKQFLLKLKELLDDFNATITWGCSPYSDTHGIHGEYMSVSMDDKVILTLHHQSHIDAYSIKVR